MDLVLLAELQIYTWWFFDHERKIDHSIKKVLCEYIKKARRRRGFFFDFLRSAIFEKKTTPVYYININWTQVVNDELNTLQTLLGCQNTVSLISDQKVSLKAPFREGNVKPLRVMIFSDESGSMHISENKSNWVCIFYTGFFFQLHNLSGRRYKKKVWGFLDFRNAKFVI